MADPFQRYRGLEVAADSPTHAEREQVPYHLVGDLELSADSSAGEYAPRAHAAIDDILQRGRVPIVTGGTGLYLRAALADLDFPSEPDPQVRASVEAFVTADVGAALDELRQRAPKVADRIDVRNPRRVSRALMLARTGQTAPPSDGLWTAQTRHPTLIVGVSRPRDVLDRLIAARVERERGDGLIAELEQAMDSPGFSRGAAQIIGVKEVRALQSGDIAASEVSTLLAARTRKLARAQLTWMRKTPHVHEIDLGEAPAVDGLAALQALWEAPEPGRSRSDWGTLT